MRSVRLPALVTSGALGLAALTGCAAHTSTSSAPASAPPAPPASASAASSIGPAPTKDTDDGDSGKGDPTAGQGCAVNKVAVPAGAKRTSTADLDGDGKGDVFFLADDDATMGVRTSSGRTISTKFSVSEGGQLGARSFVDSSGNAVILLDGPRTSYLFALVDCAIVVTKNVQGSQYTFDNGFRKPGTGVGCGRGARGFVLEGLRAAPQGDGYGVQTTVIELHDGGRSATNGKVTTGDSIMPKDQAYSLVKDGFSCDEAQR
ncbi:hypothetical protein [Winogradskya humida]|uniref:FG-GAP repeat protein n=1 Tax=Winogradskya humida TaxID=113566 RepID=A0ABQ3ZTW6_9ACTN|nr:hypothetical protein [Actinoplanes humidus]GIE22037.1 hypothetical protein Ahu01nite_051390 [Actinoplanes humidus]